jgi:N-acetylmuramoyl-L-alanine amidase
VANHLNAHQNVEVFFSHDLNDGVDQSLQSRTDLANSLKVDAFVSIHANAATATSAKGIETFVHPRSPQQTKDLGLLVHNNLINATGAVNRGLKTSDFHVLRETNMNAVLVECGFMTNAEELVLLKSADYREKCAVGIARGLIQFYGLQLKPQPAPQPVPQPAAPAATGSLYRVIVEGNKVGAFGNVDNVVNVVRENVEKGVKEIRIERV